MMKTQHGVMLRIQCAILTDEIQQMRHLLKIRGHVRVVEHQMCVVELNVDNVQDFALVGIEFTGALRSRERRTQQRERNDLADT